MSAVAFVVIVVGLALAVTLAWPTREELEKFERLEKSFEPTTYLELGVVLVGCAVLCAVSAVVKLMVGVL